LLDFFDQQEMSAILCSISGECDIIEFIALLRENT